MNTTLRMVNHYDINPGTQSGALIHKFAANALSLLKKNGYAYDMLDLLSASQRLWLSGSSLPGGRSAALSARLGVLFAPLSGRLSYSLPRADRRISARAGGRHA